MIDLRFWSYRALDQKIRDRVLERDNYTCRNCAHMPATPEVHHIVAVRLGGSDDLDNLVTLCHKCHKIVEPPRSMKYPVRVTADKTTIQILVPTLEKLRSLGQRNEDVDSIISRLMAGEFFKKRKEAA